MPLGRIVINLNWILNWILNSIRRFNFQGRRQLEIKGGSGALLAVGDQRTSSIVVSASQMLINQVESIIADLDASSAQKQTLRVFHMNNSTRAQVAKVLGPLFQKEAAISSTANSTTQTDALENRSTSQMQNRLTGTQTPVGGSSRGGGLGTAGGSSSANRAN
jgi:hypothetical protein